MPRTWILSLLAIAALTLQGPTASAQSAAPAILALRTSRAPRARVRAVQEISRTRPDGGRQALEIALNDRAPGVRRAAAITLGELGDPAAINTLNAHLTDRDRNVRLAVQASVRALTTLQPSRGSAPTASNGAAARALAAAMAAPTDWRQVRVIVSIDNIANRGSNNPADVVTMRRALQEAVVAAAPDFGLHRGGPLPAAAALRMRSRAARWLALEGSLTSLQRSVEPGGIRVRAEISLAILAEPAHNIIGTVNTSASAQEQVFPSSPDPTPRLAQSAIEVAARGAIQRMQESFAAPARRGRR